jgi:hypothetical protein
MIMVQAGLSKKPDPISKITREKRAEGMAQVVEYLPSKHQAPSSNSSPTKKERKKQRERERERDW